MVDQAGRLVGMITADDVVHIIQEEASEDTLLLSGAGAEGDINEPVSDSYKARVRWLAANLVTALVASTIIYLFGAAIEEMVALAVLMPIVASIGGNAGTQTMAVAVRALAMNQLTRSNTWRTIWREISVALLNGVTIAILLGLGAGLVFANPQLGGVIAAAMLINIMIAGLSGVAVPVVLERLGQDPGGLLLGVRDDDHRFDGLPRLPRAGRGDRAGRLRGTVTFPPSGAKLAVSFGKVTVPMTLHMSKVAFSCASIDTLRRRLESRVRDGVVPIVTRFRPKRADELIGGSLYWIVKQRIAARQTILGFDLRSVRPEDDHPARSRAGAGAGDREARASGLALSRGRGRAA